MQTMIEALSLTRRFGPFTAVDRISLQVERGEVLGFLGPNGAGKSTTMKMITGFLAPTTGTARICGADIQSDPLRAKSHLGYLPEGAASYGDMSCRGFLDFVAEMRGFSGAELRRRRDIAVERLELADVLEQPIDTLSKGYRRRVGLAQALLHDPDVLVLDEPTDGLDPNQQHQVRRLITEMAPEKAIIISTHILQEVDAVCSRAVVIAHGRLVADGRPAELEARSRYHNAVYVEFPQPVAAEIVAELRSHGAIAEVEQISRGDTEHADATALRIFPTGGKPIADDLVGYFRVKGIQFEQLRIERGRLDDVFRSLTARSEAA